MMILLSKNSCFAKGSERACYINPEDNKKIIKILYNQKNDNNQNELEYEYYKHLNSKITDFTHITKCYGWTDTTLGRGLVFDRIVNYDGSESKQLTYFLRRGYLNIKKEKLLLNELKNYLEKNGILFMDVATLNVLCQEISQNKYKLVIIDGLGAKRKGIKFFLYKNFPFYNKYKINKQWNRFIKLVNKVRSEPIK